MKSLLVVIALAAFIGVECAEVVKNAPETDAPSAEPEAEGPPTSLKCFTCNSKIDPECADDFDKDNVALVKNFVGADENTVNCVAEAGGSVYCKKVKMWLNGETRVERGCGHNKREYKEPCFQSRADDHVVDTCQCEEDFCNGTPYLAAPGALSVVAAAMVALRA